MKELDEARKAIDDLVEDIWRDAQERVTRDIETWKRLRREQILNLKGDGWKIALVKDEIAHSKYLGLPEIAVIYRQVIWEGEKC